MKIKSIYYVILFGIGFFGYGLLEVIWRGRTHPSMSLAGGIAFCVFSIIAEKLKPLNFVYRCIAGGIFITFLELIFGIIFNIWLKTDDWDYSMFRFNYLGQICITYSVLWCLISAPVIIALGLIKDKIYTDYKFLVEKERF